jgi:hypothetical protein
MKDESTVTIVISDERDLLAALSTILELYEHAFSRLHEEMQGRKIQEN